MPADRQIDVRRVPKWTQNPPKTCKNEVPGRSPKGTLKKKLKISNPCIICYVLRTSSPCQNHDFWSLFAPKNGLRASPKGVARRGCQMMSLLHSKTAKKGPRRNLMDPRMDPKSIQNRFFWCSKASELQHLISGVPGGGVPEPISFQK